MSATSDRTPRLAAGTARQQLPEGFAHRFVPLPHGHVHVVEGGDPDGAPVVLLAGFPEDWRAWGGVLPALAAHHHVLAVDLPGQGLSDPADRTPTTVHLADLVHDAVATLTDRPYALLTHDVGSWVGFAYGLRHQRELTGLALLDAGIPGVSLPSAVPLDPDLLWKTWHFAFHQVADLPEILLEGKEREYLTWFLRHKTKDHDTFPQATIDAYAETLADQGGMGTSLDWYRAIPESALLHQELLQDSRFRIPVLAVSAEYGSIPDMAVHLAPNADDVTGARIADSGHFIPEEQPEALAETLLHFLRRLRPTA